MNRIDKLFLRFLEVNETSVYSILSKNKMTLDKVISPEGRYITFGGSRHKQYIIKKEMPLPIGWRLLLQNGDRPNRWSVYKK